MRVLAAICGILAYLAVALPTTAAVIELEPTGSWGVDYSDDSCSLYRNFGDGERTIFMEMRQFSPDRNEFQFIVKSDGFRVPNSYRRRQEAARFLPAERPYFIENMLELHFPDGDEGATFTIDFFWYDLDPATARNGVISRAEMESRMAAIMDVELSEVFNRDVLLKTGSFAAPLAALRTCMDELQLHWGIDVEAHRTLSRQVVPRDSEVWVSEIQESYPTQHANAGRQAILRIRVDVSAEGQATGCHMQRRLGDEDFERAACQVILEHAQFDPALDVHGSAIASYYIMTINYQVF